MFVLSKYFIINVDLSLTAACVLIKKSNSSKRKSGSPKLLDKFHVTRPFAVIL